MIGADIVDEDDLVDPLTSRAKNDCIALPSILGARTAYSNTAQISERATCAALEKADEMQ
jgi:hypothetical protein